MSTYCIASTVGAEEWKILGCVVSGMTMPELNELVSKCVAEGEISIIANHNLHSLYLWHNNWELRQFYSKANCAHVDGMGLVFLAKILGIKLRRDQRVTYVDWVPSLMQCAAEQGWRVFYLGSRPGVAAKAAGQLRKLYPDLVIETEHGYFDLYNGENHAVLRRIRDFAPNLLMVGMGMPRQEQWILSNLAELPNATILPCGAAFDYFGGALPTPPRWAGRIGVEWLCRLAVEPRRLWKRYLLEPWFLASLVLRYWVGNVKDHWPTT